MIQWHDVESMVTFDRVLVGDTVKLRLVNDTSELMKSKFVASPHAEVDYYDVSKPCFLDHVSFHMIYPVPAALGPL